MPAGLCSWSQPWDEWLACSEGQPEYLAIYVPAALCLDKCYMHVSERATLAEWVRLLLLRCLSHVAGEVLQGERDALLKLVQGLRREYEAVQLAKTGQQAELQSIKVGSCRRGL